MPSPNQLIASLPYFTDSAVLFSAYADQPWAVFLDSGFPHSNQGRYDIIAAEPVCTLVTHGDTTEIIRDGRRLTSTENPFDVVKQQLALYPDFAPTELPFNGGAIGYFAYDLARRLETLPVTADDAEHIAEMAVGIYQWAVVVDHQQQKSYLIGQCEPQQWQALIRQFSHPPATKVEHDFKVVGEITSNMDKDFYIAAFDRIKHYLKEGDCYQVNLAQRFVAACEGDPWTAYQSLRQLNAAPFSGYLNLPEVQILSSSPERFLKLTGGVVETKPIKGTRPRKADYAEDQQQIKNLEISPKDRAENLMIVDLLRNDISKTCKNGSVKVPVLFDVESYTTVHHLVSTVTGILADDKHALDLLKSCFPGGSITGAPKVRAMEIIEELEPNRRGVYCGAIGYIGFNGNMDTNIAIRTLVHSKNTIRFWAGGGIVNDSVAEEEYQESFDKAAAMLDLLRQFSG
ncbi:MAG: aminodeoxychorismate synthase component I [Methylobacter sp.]|nr:aminodeoxychorismate synthase component I [Methylobacter sp.]MDP2429425.1 aminodeoxychorismate synthase component I [Methylobacter sp.]MDP3056634.1 aminodeoxychorismate synthase component I [Methylobacter sp.]MDP3362167.1 aminodeoxychorismate synthase component I [Methylobacter sp.]MDZ4220764.1 aminodeoxychorismate synthase component I [Methylobacter sp.]